MKSIVTTARVPIKLWVPVEQVEACALDQLINTANLPCVFRHIAAMPDVHLGYGATVGSVVACKGAVIPGAVGVDIGCGMMAVQLPVKASDLPDSLKALRREIERAVPVGFEEHKVPVREGQAWEGWKEFQARPSQLQNRRDKARRQLGTLGGGNHFIEVCLDQSQQVWVMLHSGSRNIGKEIAEVHMYQAKKLWQQHRVALTDPDLAYLEEGTAQFKAYWNDLQWAQEYAFMNREVMMRRVLDAVTKVLRRNGPPLRPLMEVNCHPNYPSGSTTSGIRSLSPARARCAPNKAISPSFPAPWAHAPISFVGAAIPNPTSRAPMGPAGACRVGRPSARSRSRI